MLRAAVALSSLLLLAACSGGGGSATPPQPPSVSVSLTPGTAALAPGGTTQFSAAVSNASNTAVTWAVQEGGSGGSISASGLYTAPANPVGYNLTYHVVATSQADPTKSATATVTIGMGQVILSPSSVLLAPGGSQQFSASVNQVTGNLFDWSIQEGAAGGSISASGLYTAPASVQGTNPVFHVVASAKDDPTKRATAAVTIGNQPVIASFAATPSTINPGGTAMLSWSVANATTLSINQGVGTVTGTTTAVQPTATTIYTLTAGNGVNQVDASVTVTVNSASGNLALVAGDLGGSGNLDGPGSAARFNNPQAVAMDPSGNAYIADAGNHTIRKFSPAGQVSTFAGSPGLAGHADGAGAAARFNGPSCLAWDPVRNGLLVGEVFGYRIRLITPAGVVTTLAGSGTNGGADGSGIAAQLRSPRGIVVDSGGTVFVSTDGSTIRKILPDGTVSTLAGSDLQNGYADGAGATARFYFPSGLALDAAGNLIVCDSWNQTLRRVAPDGTVSTFAGVQGSSGATDGQGSAARLAMPRGITTDPGGNFWITDGIRIRKISPSALVSTMAGSGMTGSTDGVGAAASFSNPSGLAVLPSGDLLVADSSNNTLRRITQAGVVTTVAGAPPRTGYTDGQGSTARFNLPLGIAADGSGNLFVCDVVNGTIRKITPGGSVSTFAGSGGRTLTDGKGTAAAFDGPRGIASDALGNLIVADTLNNAIRRILPDATVSTLAGTENEGSADGQGSAASFKGPWGVAVDAAGWVFVADSSNHLIRKISPGGLVSTVAGSAGQSGSTDGIGSAARFNIPAGIAVDGAGNLFVCDRSNNTLRRIAPDGTVTTFAGSPGEAGTADGQGSAARFNRPTGIIRDPATGNFYVADSLNSLIRKVTPSGQVSTLAGQPGLSGAILGALPGVLASPAWVTLAPDGSLVFTMQNGVVRLTP